MSSLETYWITPPLSSDPQIFQATLQATFDAHTIHKASLRGANFPPQLLDLFAKTCHVHYITSFLNLPTLKLSIQKALEHGFKGVHVKGAQILGIPHIPANLQIFYSAHNAKEVLQALDLGAHFCTISPICATPNKPPPLGLDYLDQFSLEVKAHLFALGGMGYELASLLEDKGLKGFAGTRCFVPNVAILQTHTRTRV
ncbi:thiamine phosphate synthase [Helicobacter mehlei]|uniref:Thiamine phosphate synthase n=1 Tax=Helicobacter mehlei TaxID=2316080 RepID=A0A553UPG5_9HELI|nr:thiamine phosphate synthase [Helicobacter mehlei]TSA82106.1 thiamine phosphate synthase [Helicobacter mehlei]